MLLKKLRFLYAWLALTILPAGAALATTCPNATNIPSLPVNNQSLVCGTTNDITSTSAVSICGAADYYGGLEALYTFTPTSNVTVQISYTGQTWTGIMVYAGCPTTTGSTCVGQVQSSGSSKNLVVSLTGGTQYYIMFDTWPSPASPCTGTFSMSSCITPTAMTSTAVGTSTATLGFTSSATQWQIERGTSNTLGNAANSRSIVTSSSNPIASLTPNTQYYWWVRSVCAPGDTSAWTASSTFTTLPLCSAPTAVNATLITTTSAQINWTAPSSAPSNGYDYEVRTSGAAGSGPTGLVASATTAAAVVSVPVGGLLAGTVYTVYVRGNCGGTTLSTWTTAYTFATLCNTILAPYTESFTTATTPVCWTNAGPEQWLFNQSGTSGSTNPDYGADGISDHTGNSGYFAWVDGSGSGTNTGITLTSPVINISPLTNPRLRFYVFSQNTTANGNNLLKIEVLDNSVWVLKDSVKQNLGTGWFEKTVSLSGLTSTSIQVRFVVNELNNIPSGFAAYENDILIDDVSFEATPSCLPPTAVNATAITANSATINWTASTSLPANGYQYEIRTSGAAGSGPTGLVTAGTTGAGIVTANITALTGATTYTIYVRAVCAAASFSTWTSAQTFTTTLDCSTAPVLACGVSQTATIATGNGAYNNNACGFGTPGREALYTFTPATTGTYTLNVTAATGGYADYMYKPAAGGCGPTGWTCIDDINGPAAVTFTLTGGTQYFFMLDPENTTGMTHTFNILCCAPPTAPAAGSITQNSASLSWTHPGAAQYQIAYAAGPAFTPITFITTTASPYTLGTLSASTAYGFQVRAICGPGDTSAWTAAVYFNTLCPTSPLPFAESFSPYPTVCWSEARGFLGAGSNTLTPGDYSWLEDGYNNSSSTGAAKINLYTTGKRDWLISPSIDLGAAGTKVVEFDLGIVAYAGTTATTLGSDDSVAVAISTDNGVTWNSSNILRTWTAANTPITGGSQRIYIPINGYSGTVKFGFYGSEGTVDDAPDNDIFIDSFRVVNCTLPVVNLGNDTTICGGNTLTLSSGTGTSYLWSTSATTQSIPVAAAGTYWVRTVNGSMGCATTDTIVVSAGTVPVVNLGNDTTICAGNTVSFNAGNAGAAYLWSTAATTQSITAATTGTYHVRVTNAQGCVGRDTVVLSVSALPVVNLGNDTAICAGNSATFNAGNTGAAYLWNNAATTQSINVTTAGSYSVRVTNAAGCIGRDTVVLTVNALPVVNLGNDTTVCGNVASLVLNAGNPGSSYVWTPSLGVTTQTYDVAGIINQANATNASPNITGLAWIAQVTNAQGCVATDSIIVGITWTARVSGITVTGASPTFSFAPAGDSFATAYNWSFGDNSPNATTATTSHTYTANGTYNVMLVVSNDCGTDTAYTTVTVTGVGITETLSPNTVKMYPNPATHSVTIENLSNLSLQKIQVLNSMGAIVAEQAANGDRAVINTEAMANGIYTVRILTDKGIVNRRLQVLK